MRLIIIFLQAIDIVLDVVQWVVLVWVILSWILFFLRESQFRWRHRQFHNALEILNDFFERMTRPFLRPIRRFLRRFDTAGIDWSPMVLVLIIWIVRQILRLIQSELGRGLILSQ